MQVAKPIKLPVLLNLEEMSALFAALDKSMLYDVQNVVATTEGSISHALFLERYKNYLQAVWEEKEPLYRTLSPAISTTEKAFKRTAVDENRIMIKPVLPIIQIQPHNIGFSHVDQTFRSMVFGPQSIAWGVQFSYPTLYQNPKTFAIEKIDDQFPNTALFHTLRRWIREHTRPTPFLVEGKKVNVPVRLGKSAFEWAQTHPQLKKENLHVVS